MEPRSARLRLRVSPGASRAVVVGRHGDAWKVRVSAPAERGRANDELVGLLAAFFGIRRADVRVVAGAQGRDKVIELTGVSVSEARGEIGCRNNCSGR